MAERHYVRLPFGKIYIHVVDAGVCAIGERCSTTSMNQIVPRKMCRFTIDYTAALETLGRARRSNFAFSDCR